MNIDLFGNHFIANKNAKVYNEAVLRFLMR